MFSRYPSLCLQQVSGNTVQQVKNFESLEVVFKSDEGY